MLGANFPLAPDSLCLLVLEAAGCHAILSQLCAGYVVLWAPLSLSPSPVLCGCHGAEGTSSLWGPSAGLSTHPYGLALPSWWGHWMTRVSLNY